MVWQAIQPASDAVGSFHLVRLVGGLYFGAWRHGVRSPSHHESTIHPSGLLSAEV
jgi:hypothetical protein